MANAAFLDHMVYALGDEPSSVEETAIAGRTDSTAEALAGAGFSQHWVCRPETTAYDLAHRAVDGIADRLDGVGAIVYATCIPANANIGDVARFRDTGGVKHLMDFPVSHLQADFGLQQAFVIGLDQQACTGMLGSLRLAKALLTTEPELRRVLCVTSDRFPEGAVYEQAYNLISDGAAACIASLEPAGFRIVTCHGETNGAMVMPTADETVGSYFSYAHRVIQETLAKAGLAMDDIAYVVPQNTNAKAWEILARLLGFDYSRVYPPSLAEVGHVISGDNIINLKRLVEAEGVKKGQRVMLFMAGYGMNWQCVILERS